MRNLVLKTCVTSLFLSMSGLAAANSIIVERTAPGKSVSNDSQLPGHSAVAGAALSVAAGSFVSNNLAAQAALTIGALSVVQDLYAGAAVTLGGGATAQSIYAGAAAGIATNAVATTIHAGAAITVGAGGSIQNIYSGAAITLGAGSKQIESDTSDVFAGAARTGTLLADDPFNVNYKASENNTPRIALAASTFNISNALADLGNVQDALSSIPVSDDSNYLGTSVGIRTFSPGVYSASAVNTPADTVISLNSDGDSDKVWIFNLTDALTMGAGTKFDTSKAPGAIVIWNVGGALNLGAGTEFYGTAYISGSVSGATSTVSCGNLYANGAVAIGSMGQGVGCPSLSITVNVNEETGIGRFVDPSVGGF
jgi:hypothetical protein